MKVRDAIDGGVYDIYASTIVNAAGPWVDTLRELDKSKTSKHLELTKGVHLVIDQSRFPLKQAVYFDTPDGRMVFAIPRDGKAYVGTTDTVYKGDAVNPRMTSVDRQYIVDAINYMFPSVGITIQDVESSWAGLRPLIFEEGKSASEISRKDEIWESDSGLITIAGGKLTGYRKMAEMVVDRLDELFKKEGVTRFTGCITKPMPISGGHVGGPEKFLAFIERKTAEGVKRGFRKEQAELLVRKYGSNIDRLFELVSQQEGSGAKLDLPMDVQAMILYALEAEMTVKPIDFFNRRTGKMLFDIAWVREYKAPVIDFMAQYLGWSEEQRRTYSDELEKYLHEAVTPAE
ncbi:Aerobic glycerol-3-phosphate dehydrogenase [compost metagenome]